MISAFSTLMQLAISIKPHGACWSSKSAGMRSNIPSASSMLTAEHLLLSFSPRSALLRLSARFFFFRSGFAFYSWKKGHKTYGKLMSYVRCRLSFALLRSAIMCIRGSRSAYHRPVNSPREVALIEVRILIMEWFSLRAGPLRLCAALPCFG